MKFPNHPAGLNRGLLFTAGLILLAAGAFELGTRFRVLHLVPPHQALTFLAAHPPRWVSYLALAIAVVAGLAAAGWLAAQLRRRPRTGTWRLTADPGRGVTVMPAQSAAAPLEADIEAYDGVRTVAAVLAGPRHRPALYLQVRTELDTDLTALRREIGAHALPRLRGALELEELPAALLITPTSASTPIR